MYEKKGCLQSFFLMVMCLFLSGLGLASQPLWAKTKATKTVAVRTFTNKPVAKTVSPKTVSAKLPAFVTTEINCVSAYGVVMTNAGDNYNSPGYGAALQARLRLINQLEAKDASVLKRIYPNDQEIAPMLSTPHALHPALTACDQKYGYQVAQGIPKPDKAYVPKVEAEPKTVTFTNTATEPSYSPPQRTQAEIRDEQCVSLLGPYDRVVSDVNYQLERYNQLVEMNSMPHMIEAQGRIAGSSASYAVGRMNDLISEATRLGCDSSVVDEWRYFRDQLKSIAYKY